MELERFTAEVVPMGRKLYRFALSYLKEEADAEDAVQEVMIKLWDRRHKLGEYRSLEAFAMTVTRNHCLDRIRGRHTVSWEATPGMERQEVRERSPQEHLELSDHVQKVKEIMLDLPEQQREIIQLRDVEGYEFDEIAEITGMNINLIRVNLSRARKKIRETLINWNDYGMERDRISAGKVLRG